MVGAVASSDAEAQRRATADSEWRYVPLVGLNEGYLDQAEKTYGFDLRASEFATDAEVWTALRTRDDVGILTREMIHATLDESANVEEDAPPETFLGDPEAREEFEHDFRDRQRLFSDFALDSAELPVVELAVRRADFGPPDLFGQSETVQAPPHAIRVIGVLDARATLAPGGLQVGPSAYAAVTGEPFTGDSYYIKVVDGADVQSVAREVESAFLSSGLNASILSEQFAQGQALTRGILRLFQGFMALGLLVGIAALGVISSRTVMERRQQVGMLRAIGFQPRMVALSFVLEASFIALTGLLIGALAGLSLGRNMVRTFFDVIADGRSFATPWGQIIVVVLLAYVAALLATLVPAIQAARIYPAEALRYE